MKKILLGTSALIGAALLAGAAQADDPKVTIGGFSTFEAGWTNSDNKGGEDNRAFRNDNEIHFNVAGKTDAGLGYGAEIDLQADINGAGNSNSPSTSAPGFSQSGIVAHRTYGWLQGDNWGHLEFGSNDGVARTLKVDASNIARATGGIDGDFKYFADVNTSIGGVSEGPAGYFGAATRSPSANFITSPRLPVENGPASGFYSDVWGNDDKITYYTPRFAGFQLGVSYAPSLTNRGELSSRADTSGVLGGKDIWEGGLNYENQFDQVGVAAGVTGEMGTVSNDGLSPGEHINDLRAWNAGAKVSYLGFSLAGSYGDWRDSFDLNGTKADYWTVGGAYEFGPIGASVTYLSSEDKPTGFDNKFQDISAGIDYKLAPGLTPFAEYTWYDIDPSGTLPAGVNENKGSVVIVGSELSF